MAFVDTKEIQRVAKNRNKLHIKVDATYSSFATEYGNKILQIDTYGSSDRQIQGKISQSIQLDKSSAQKLIKLLKAEFNIK